MEKKKNNKSWLVEYKMKHKMWYREFVFPLVRLGQAMA